MLEDQDCPELNVIIYIKHQDRITFSKPKIDGGHETYPGPGGSSTPVEVVGEGGLNQETPHRRWSSSRLRNIIIDEFISPFLLHC